MSTFTRLALSESARQAVLKELPAAATLSRSTCRSLFGPVDHDELKRDLKEQLKEMQTLDCLKWNFDFQTDTPLYGEFAWESLKSEKLPGFYRETFVNGAGIAVPTPVLGKEQKDRLTFEGLRWNLDLQTDSQLFECVTWERLQSEQLPSADGETGVDGAGVAPTTSVLGKEHSVGRVPDTEPLELKQGSRLGLTIMEYVKENTSTYSSSSIKAKNLTGTSKGRAAIGVKRTTTARTPAIIQNPITDYFAKRKRTTASGPPKVAAPPAPAPPRPTAEALSEMHRKRFR